MGDKSIYIQPDSDDYAGYSTFVFSGSTTSSYGDLHSVGGEVFTIIKGEEYEGGNGDVLFPALKEEDIVDEGLLRFYKNKGYKI